MRAPWALVSVFAHAAAVTAAIVAPLLAAGTLPEVRRPMTAFVRVQLPTHMPAAARPPEVPRTSRPSIAPAAPVSAPDGIAPERPAPPPSIGLVVEGGLDPEPGSGVALGFNVGDPVGPPPPPDLPRVVVPVRVGGIVREPRRIAYAKPEYPLMAQSARVEGDVILEAVIGTDGTVQDLRVVQSSPLLDQAALEAVRQWRYTPTLLNGTPVAVVMSVRVSFRLR